MDILKRNKVLIIVTGILLLLSIFLELSVDAIVDYSSSDWKKISTEKTEKIESETIKITRTYQDDLLTTLSEFKNDFTSLYNSEDFNERNVFLLLNNELYKDFHFQVFDSDSQLFAWSSKYGNVLNFNSSGIFQSNECFFYESSLMVFLTTFEAIDKFKIYIAMPVEKEYTISSKSYEKISLTDYLKEKFNTSVQIEYIPSIDPVKDGRKYSFPITNNYKNNIANIVIEIPYQSKYKSMIRDIIYRLQSYIIMTAFFLLGILLYNNKMLFRYRLFKLIIVSIYFIALRILIYLFGIPSKLLVTDLNKPDYFSSSFAFGLVKSPIEFLLTALIIFIIIFISLRMILQYLKSENDKSYHNTLYMALSVFFVIVFLLALRGFGATIRSVVFESTIHYFKYPALLPDLPIIVMDFNILVLGFCTVLLLIFLCLLMIVFTKKFLKTSDIYIYSGIFLLLQVSAFLFDVFQNQPQGTPLLRISSIFIIFIFTYNLYRKRNATAIYIISLLFFSSLITIGYLSYYNSDYEKKSLRTTAYELLKTDESFIARLVESTLENEQINQRLVNLFNSGIEKNYNAAAFKIWSISDLEKETLSTLVNIIDRDKKLLGKYGYQFSEDFVWDWESGDSLLYTQTSIIQVENSDNKIIRGIKPIYKKQKLLGYVEISILHDLYSFDFLDNPEFFAVSKTLEQSPINIKQLKIFDYQNNELINYYTDIIPSKPESEVILNSELNKYNEAWVTFPLNGINHVIYIKKVLDVNKKRIIAVALAEKDVTWSLFDFFKIFFIHTIFILAGLVLIYFGYLKQYFKVRYSFRTQLLFAFIFISTIPLLFLAIYFKNLTDDKNTAATYYKLGKRADGVESYLNDYIDVDSSLPDFILLRAAMDLGINYDLFKDERLIFSSKTVYYDVGLMPRILNGEVYANLVLTGLREFVVDESVENYNFHSFYHKAKIGGEEYLIKVSDVFNSIQLPMSSSEVDIFLFGSYSLAILLIIIFSSILANQISSPIRRLTNATKAVAAGDLTLSIEGKNRGEIQELIDGFNEMVKELDKNQKELAEIERHAAWRDMAKQVAHEIKNPLTPMKLAVQQLVAAKNDRSEKFDEIFTKVSDTVIKQIDILKNIANEFSNYARMPDLKLEKINLYDVLVEVSNLFMDRQIEIVKKFDLKEYIVYADSEQLQRTLVNLVRNSMQASATRIEFNITFDDDVLNLVISDNGHGIPLSIKDRIFDADFTTKVEGMGLGLHMAKRFLESIKANIELKETSSAGTSILITFPTVTS